MRFPESLDIVIPAYKARFLRELLESLASQTSEKFSVIVSDDASPEPLEPICAAFSTRLRIRYVRFEKNLGARDLAGHWNRSVGLSNAQWVLLPGDDDILEQNCVESFWNTATHAPVRFNLFSFGVRIIDKGGSVLRDRIPPASTETAAQYIKQRLDYRICPVPVAYVFSRKSLEQAGGFVSFDQGWHSDEATWLLLSAGAGIQPIADAFIRWRVSDINISPGMANDHVRSTRATLAYLSWLDANASRLGMTKVDVRRVTDDSICWSLYERAAQVSFPTWLHMTWNVTVALQRHGDTSLPRHLFRFARARLGRAPAPNQGKRGQGGTL